MTSEVLATTQAGAPAPASGARQVWRRLRARKAAVVAGAGLALLVLLALAAPLLSALTGQDPNTYHDDLVDSARGGVPTGTWGGISAEHWLGVEPGTGRDLFIRLAYGARVSLVVAVGATLLQVLIGVIVGIAAGFGSRFVDGLLSHVSDVFIALPMLAFVIALTAVVPADFPRPLLLVLVIALFGWAGTARVVRAQTLSLKKLDFVAAARLGGSGPFRVARRELLPSLAAPVITYSAILLPSNIVAEAALSFLGVGIRPPTPSWGQMLSTATTWFRADPAYVLLPAGLLFLTVLAFTVIGDALRVALDPREASRLGVGRRRTRNANKADNANKVDEAGGASVSARVSGAGAADTADMAGATSAPQKGGPA
ncbi:ABC transporter permease [Streptomyces sp. AC536]|uniref:ABC transporter permease n=1 Tax=Streptomyces buecherae TaxID=2763006 RepID=UPI00164E1AA9|nr:ABC transporter permease [Streptomyces buecherae]MBC3983362.1 ABC transporter permease [Streptomyces buecherae]QNJ40247.1 ABC transporter permease [Streptomyces buecherae]